MQGIEGNGESQATQSYAFENKETCTGQLSWN